VAETLCRASDSERFDARILCLNYLGAIGEQLRRDGFVVHELPRPDHGPDYFASRRIAELLRREHIDVMHTHNTQALMHGGLAAMQAPGRRLIHTDHARSFPDSFKYHVIERIMSTVAFRVVGVSEHTTDNLHRYEWIPRRKLVTIPNGVDGGFVSTGIDRPSVRLGLGVPDDAEVLLFAARLEEQKGGTFLLQALAHLAPTRPRLHLVLAGEGSLADELASEAVALGISDRVHFLGVRLDVPQLLRAVELFVLPSVWEGLPMVILEALAAGCPVVATDVGGISSAIRDGVTGALVSPRDVSGLADAIGRTLDSPEDRERFAREGRALFSAVFSAEAMTRRYEALYVGGNG
jgi:glycosyltransferase involved in cell wall biosynthesis